MKGLAAIVLAAGKGKRMRSAVPKVLHPVAGRPMLHYPLEILARIKPEKTVVVVGHGAGQVEDAFKGLGVVFARQREQLGTAHAVTCALKALRGFSGKDVLILSGDVPLITEQTIKALMALHRRGPWKKRPLLSFVSVNMDDPTGYGRVIRDEFGEVFRIVEQREIKGASEERSVKEVNAGIYIANMEFLKKGLKRLNRKNAQVEYYLTDLVSIARLAGGRAAALCRPDAREVMGINNRVELAEASAIMRQRVLKRLMLRGVTIMDPATAYVDSGVKVGRDTTIYPNVHLEGETTIGAGSTIEQGVRITGARLGRGCMVKSHTLVEGAVVGADVTLGPFARLRPGTVVKDRAKIGNFVEVKNSVIGRETKANHLSYIGDAIIGDRVNIGAGVVTCNYDGKSKHVTRILDKAFIGSDTQLIAPVTIGKGAYVGSGSTITSDVPAGALALTRPEQRVIEGWAEKRGRKGKR